MKKHVYRQGDLVRIVRPLVVTRVGYPFDLKAEAARIGDVHYAAICALLDEVLPELAPTHLDPNWHAYTALTHKIAYIVGARRGMGGKERRIYTDNRPDILDHQWCVESKRTTMTGTYYSPGGSYDDYEPGGLSGASCHLLLTVYRTDYFGEQIEIEAANVAPFAGVLSEEGEECAA